MNPINPKKLHLSKWTAVRPVSREKHFLVSRVLLPNKPDERPEFVEIEAVHSGSIRRMPWRELTDETTWRQGWVA